MTSVCSNPPKRLLTRPSTWPLCLSVSCQTKLQHPPPPPCGCTSSATKPLPKITQPRRCLIAHTGTKSPSVFYFLMQAVFWSSFFFSFGLAASCGLCTPNEFWWNLISCSFLLAHLQVPIQAVICQVTDDQWSCWLTCSRRVPPSRVRCTHYPHSNKPSTMLNDRQ